MPLGLIFIISLVIFVLIILFFSWYTKFIMNRIFGRMNDAIHSITVNGIPPAAWDEKLIKRMRNVKSDKDKTKAFNQHLQYLDGEFRNMLSFTRQSSYILDEDHKAEIIDSLNSFKEEYIDDLRTKLGIPTDHEDDDEDTDVEE